MASKVTYTKTVEEGQSLFDLTIQEYGDIQGIFLLLFDNPGSLIGDVPTPGQSLAFRDNVPEGILEDQSIMDFYRKNNIRVNNSNTFIP